ncbi:MAG: TMEM165/GDT1 family protein [Prochlorothrix sp.]|nr:TMEM165/GDT1 family protein [Prochlorothrix sp.]
MSPSPAPSMAENPRSQPEDTASRSSEAQSSESAWQVFGSTFLTILLAELGDKTQLTTLLMSAESQKPWIVFLGAGSALILTSLLGVLLGRWLANQLQPRTLNVLAGLVLLTIAATLFVDVVPTLL